ncbi:MAG TPA: hypothetical protein VGF45_16120 [Polyangia bacterium]
MFRRDYGRVSDYAAAFAAGVYLHSSHDWKVIAQLLRKAGLGSYDPAELCEAVGSWADEHCGLDLGAGAPVQTRVVC